MKLSELITAIDNLELVCSSFLEKKEEKKDKKDKKDESITLKIKAFDEIIQECKDEVDSASFEHKIHVLKLLYGVEINGYNFSSIDNSLDNYVSGQIDSAHTEVNEYKINSIKSIILSVDEIVEKLAIEYKNILHINSKWYRFQGRKLKTYSKLLTKLMNLKEKLKIQLEIDSKKISFMIIENFYNIYIFFSFLISICIQKNREIFLIEIANRLDRYIEVIEPSFSGRVLHHDDMMYHYAIYELKELKDIIFTELAPQ
jgi:hypothetical protein